MIIIIIIIKVSLIRLNSHFLVIHLTQSGSPVIYIDIYI